LFLLDTNAASDIFKGRSHTARRALAEAQGSTRVAISVLTQAEILFGLKKRPDALHFGEAFDAFCAYVEVLPWTESAARSYAHLRSVLKERNRTGETMDLLIASQAHTLGAVVVTRDKGFRHLIGLVEVVNWATDLKQV
jgi:tRNA(fMet)-specific endonuclease VapC